MKKGTVTRLFALVLLLVICLGISRNIVFADSVIEVQNGKEYTVSSGQRLHIKLSSDVDVYMIGRLSLRICTNSACDNVYMNMTLDEGEQIPLTAGDWYIKITSGSGPFTVAWEEHYTNKTLSAADPLRVPAKGSSITVERDYGTYYFTMELTESAKLDFTKTEKDWMYLWVNKGKVAENTDNAELLELPYFKDKASLLLPKGTYTIIISNNGSHSGENGVTITRQNWTGISKLTPDNDGKIIGTVGTKFDYKVYYEPKNADSKISVKSASFGSNTRMKLKSKSNGVAVFEVDFTNDEANKQYTLPYKNNETTRSYNRVQFTSEEGVTAIAEKMAGPEAPELYGTMTGSTKAVSIPVTAHPNANKFVAYVKTKKKGWVYTGETSTNENGIYYVNCKKLNPGKKYTFRVYAYADGVKGGYLEVKGVTAYNLKPTKCKAVAKKAKFVKRKKDYEWRFNWTRGWYKVGFTDYTVHTVKISYKIPKKASGMYVTVNGKKLKSGKKLTFTLGGKTKAGKKTPIIFQTVRKSGKCIAYGPTVKVKCKLKKAK